MNDPAPRTHLADRFSDDTNFYRYLTEHSVDVVTIIDDEGLVAYQSLSIERVLGYAPEFLLGKEVAQFIHPEDVADVQAAIERVLSGAVAVEQQEYRFLHGQGDYRYIQSVAQSWDLGGTHAIIVNSRDITDQHQTHLETEKNIELLARTFSVSQNLLSISLPETGELIEVNEAWCKTLGYAREEVIGRTVLELGTWGSVANRDRLINAFYREGQLRNYEAKAYTRTGREVQLLVDAHFLTVADQPRILMSCLNLTEFRKIEDELRQSQKMEAVGQLTGGVAHDFNNLIGVTMGNAELLMDQIADRPKAAGYARQIFEAAKRGSELTHQLLAFSRRQTLAPETVHLEDHLRRLEPMLQTTVSENTRIFIHTSSRLWPSRVDPSQLETAVLNLTLNAHDAMPDGGDLHFNLSNLTVCAADRMMPLHELATGLASGDYVVLAVRDEGTGMSSEIQERVFEPFFTTKDAGKGTGLGLSMVFGFAKQSGGAIHIDSEVGVGTTLSLLLPRAIDGHAAKPDGEKQIRDMNELHRGHDETVLVVEDNEPLRKLVSHTLSGIGYRVIEARGEADLRDALACTDNIDLLVCDVILEGRSRGPDLAREVCLQFPDTAVLFMTGYSPRQVLHSNAQRVLSKPFTREECSKAVRQALDSRTKPAR